MDSMTSFPSMGSSPSAISRNTRLRPFQTFGVSILTIAHKVYTKAEKFHGPVGSISRTLAKMASPIVYTMQYQWLAVLSFADDQILAVEDVVETIFPPSAYVFDKIDWLVQISETLPGKLDNVADEFPAMIRQVPHLHWALTRLTSGLKCLTSILTDWGSSDAIEKDIMIDISCADNNFPNLPSEDKPQSPKVENDNETAENKNSIQTFPDLCDSLNPETKTGTTETDNSGLDGGNDVKIVECTHEEGLEKGKKEKLEDKEEAQKGVSGVVNEDPLLELFESSWLMKPRRALYLPGLRLLKRRKKLRHERPEEEEEGRPNEVTTEEKDPLAVALKF